MTSTTLRMLGTLPATTTRSAIARLARLGVAGMLFASVVSITASPPGVVRDLDGDGMEDAWELAHGLSATDSADALADDDGDGAINLVEYWFGTDPRVAASRHSVTVGLSSGNPWVQWAGVVHKRYQLESSADLSAVNWSSLGTPHLGEGEVFQVTDFVTTLPARRFYRVRILASFDRDGDGLDDWLETAVFASNPNRHSTSGTGIPDGWAVRYGINPVTVSPTGDPDADGANTLAEYVRGTNPVVADPPSGDAVALLRVFTPLSR